MKVVSFFSSNSQQEKQISSFPKMSDYSFNPVWTPPGCYFKAVIFDIFKSTFCCFSLTFWQFVQTYAWILRPLYLFSTATYAGLTLFPDTISISVPLLRTIWARPLLSESSDSLPESLSGKSKVLLFSWPHWTPTRVLPLRHMLQEMPSLSASEFLWAKKTPSSIQVSWI